MALIGDRDWFIRIDHLNAPFLKSVERVIETDLLTSRSVFSFADTFTLDCKFAILLGEVRVGMLVLWITCSRSFSS